MDLLLLLVLTASPVVCLALLSLLVPRSGPPSRWRRACAAVLEAVARRLRGVAEPDPFEVLRVQLRLADLSRMLQALEVDTVVYAKAHRLIATRAAYDDLLDEACLLAGVDDEIPPERGEARRMEAEMALAERGWSW